MRPSPIPIEDMVITKLFVSQNQISGAAALELNSGKFFIIEAKSVVLGTGGAGQLWRYTDCPPDSSADGYSLAYRAGAELIDMEEQLFYPTVAVFPDTIRGLEIPYERCFHPKLGGWLVNTKGEKFSPPKNFRLEISRLELYSRRFILVAGRRITGYISISRGARKRERENCYRLV